MAVVVLPTPPFWLATRECGAGFSGRSWSRAAAFGGEEGTATIDPARSLWLGIVEPRLSRIGAPRSHSPPSGPWGKRQMSPDGCRAALSRAACRGSATARAVTTSAHETPLSSARPRSTCTWAAMPIASAAAQEGHFFSMDSMRIVSSPDSGAEKRWRARVPEARPLPMSISRFAGAGTSAASWALSSMWRRHRSASDPGRPDSCVHSSRSGSAHRCEATPSPHRLSLQAPEKPRRSAAQALRLTSPRLT